MRGILVFGDSMVFGRGDNQNGGWITSFERYFESKDYYNVVYNLGVPGESTVELLERFDIEAKARTKTKRENREFTIIMSIGVNDSRGIDTPDNYRTPIEQFKENITKLIEKANKYTNRIIFMGLIPVDEDKTIPYENTYILNERIKQYNNTIKNCCEESNVLFMDQFDEWYNSDYKQLLSDGVHPNSKGYEKIFIKVKEEFEKL